MLATGVRQTSLLRPARAAERLFRLREETLGNVLDSSSAPPPGGRWTKKAGTISLFEWPPSSRAHSRLARGGIVELSGPRDCSCHLSPKAAA